MSVRERIERFHLQLRRANMFNHKMEVCGFRPALVITPEEEIELMNGLYVDIPRLRLYDGTLIYNSIRLYVRPRP